MLKSFSHKFSQNIWRILPDSNPDSDLWAIELRDVLGKKVFFAIIDLACSSVKWITSPDGTDWWTSLTAFSFGNVFLHNYRYPDLPEPTDLLMLSKESGDLQWILPNFLLVKALDKQNIEIATRKGDQFLYSKCDAETGQALAPSESDNQLAGQVILGEPIRYKEGNPYFEKISRFYLGAYFRTPADKYRLSREKTHNDVFLLSLRAGKDSRIPVGCY